MRIYLVLALAALLYLTGLLPDLAWGDGALFQKNAALAHLSPGALSHPHYILLAIPFTHLPGPGGLPGLAPTTGVTLLSTISALVALYLLHRTLLEMAVGEIGSLAGVVATGSAHLFWFHAEIPEVYALSTALFAFTIYCAVRHRFSDRATWLYLAGLSLGFSLGVHLVAVVGGFFLAGLLWMRPVPLRQFAILGLSLLLGLSPYLLLLLRGAGGLAGELGGPFLASYRLSHAPLGLLLILAAGVYSFPPIAGIFGVFGLAKIVSARPVIGRLIAATILFQVLLVAPYAVKDSVVFLLPGLWLFGLCTGFGLDRFLAVRERRRPAGAEAVLVLFFFLVPALSYSLLPGIIRRALAPQGPNRSPSVAGAASGEILLAGERKPLWRYFPGRDDLAYTLFPPKRGQSARPYAEEAAAAVEDGGPAGIGDRAGPGSLVIADWTLLTPLLYLRDVEGRFSATTDLEEVPRARQVDRARAALAEGKNVYLASLEPAYYDIEGLAGLGEIASAGPIYRLARPPAPSDTEPPE